MLHALLYLVAGLALIGLAALIGYIAASCGQVTPLAIQHTPARRARRDLPIRGAPPIPPRQRAENARRKEGLVV